MFIVAHKGKFMDMLIQFMENLSLRCDKNSAESNLGVMYKKHNMETYIEAS